MIVSHARRFVFAHVPKTGGISVRAALAPYADGEDAVSHETTHETLPELMARRPDLVGYFAFGFVRNPWERLVSFYCHARERLRPTFPQFQTLSFAQWLRQIDADAGRLERLFVLRPQRDCLDGADFIGRFETLAEDLARVAGKLGLSVALARKNASTHGPYPSYFDGWGRDFVAARYAGDIRDFGYHFGTAS
ncbi:MAG: sulfotransferase family 2 domain-containing protein [Alphaproteobacteria bacterium]|nr:sulfotransferase family 2 domain-containing protein [Alphaproteobacteria bacterium]MBV9692206.1 sulfotransferase family 2 domain-containing protein [Alphaproteobacteria bacterium]